MIDRRIGSYRVVERLGEGGMGIVYRAVDERLDRSVALKFLSRELTRDAEAKERFMVEARAASRLDHPNVCTVYEAGETEEGDAYLAMAYYDGETLERRLAREPLPVDEAIGLARQIASGLERAHAAGIVHRDVKPGNIMVTRLGEVKLLDFGLARLRDDAQLTREGTTLGTPAYMAPEQLRAEEAGPPADVWALGVVLFEMLAGRPPFGRAPSSAPAMILHEEPPLESLPPEAPPALVAVLAKALAKDPEHRYADGGALRAALASVASADSDSRMATLALPAAAPRRRLGRAVGAILVVAALAVSTWWLSGRPPATESPDAPANVAVAATGIAVLPFEVRGDPEWSYLEEGMVDLLSTKLDGAGELRSADPHAVLAATRSEESGRLGPATAGRVAERLGASLFVLGDAVAAGGNLHVTATLYGLDSAEPLARATVEGSGEELFRLIDDLTAELLAERFRDPSARVAKTAALTSQSLPAVKSYLRGESLFRAGRFGEALDAFQEAVAEDPDFALAWYRVSVGAEWAARMHLIGPATARALELADRLSERDRRLLEARAVARAGRVVEAERLYRDLVRAYPDEIEAWTQLAEVLSHYRFQTGRSMTESREAWERVLGLDPASMAALWHLARVASVEGEVEELDAIIERVLPMTPEGDRKLEIRALRIYGTPTTAGEAALLRELGASEDRVLWLSAWNVAIATDHLEGCGRILQLLDNPSRSLTAQLWAKTALASVALARGHVREAHRQLREARRQARGVGLELVAPLAAVPFAPASREELEALRGRLDAWRPDLAPAVDPSDLFIGSHARWHPALRLFALAITEARLGSGDAALARATDLEAMGESLPVDLANTVRGYQALLAGDPVAATRALDRIDLRTYNYNDAIGSIHHSATLPRYLRARALLESDRLEEAHSVLMSFGETSIADRAFEPPALILAGEALSRLDRPAEAAAAFRRALTLWADADAVLEPWLERARAGLETNSAAG